MILKKISGFIKYSIILFGQPGQNVELLRIFIPLNNYNYLHLTINMLKCL